MKNMMMPTRPITIKYQGKSDVPLELWTGGGVYTGYYLA